MTRPSSGGSAAKYPFDLPPEVEAVWQELESGLATYVAGLPAAAATHQGEGGDTDRLVLEIVCNEPGGTYPFVTLTATPEGTRVDAVVSGDARLTVQHVMAPWAEAFLRQRDWTGNDDTEVDWHRQRPTSYADKMAREVVVAMQSFGLPHPGLYTFSASGPSAATVEDLLPLIPSEVVRHEPAAEAEGKPTPVMVLMPHDHDQLRALVHDAMEQIVGGEPTVDSDGDFVVEHMGQPVFVRAEADVPCVMIFARLVHGVYSRRNTATEVSVLNRKYRWETFVLEDRSVFLRTTIPAAPFAPGHLVALLDSFRSTMTAARDDLALRARGEVA